MRKLKIATYICYAVVVVVLAVTSLLDVITGKAGTAASVYQSLPFVLLWAIFAGMALIYILCQHLWRQRATFVLHIALLIILLGALATYLFGVHGTVDIDGYTLLISRDPIGTTVTFIGYALLCIAIILFFCQTKSLFRQLLHRKTVVFVVCLSLIVAVIMVPVLTKMKDNPALNSPLLPVHVTLLVIAYALFTIIMLVGLVAIACRKNIQRAEQLRRISLTMLYPAVFLLALGICVGAVWAHFSWGRYWGWDTKETWALITLMTYALPLQSRHIAWFRNPLHLHAYLAAAFLTILMTYFGANYLLPGLHSYV